MSEKSRSPAPRTPNRQVADFLSKVAATPVQRVTDQRGRLLFAMDATASRGPTWDRACQLQGEMFSETAALGGLDIQLAWYRGFREFHASGWLHQPQQLLQEMTTVHCLGGQTQIGEVLRHAIAETRRKPINALVFVGDCMEEDLDELCHLAGQLGVLGVPAFLFQEGRDSLASNAFRQIARLTHGAWCPFDSHSARQLRELLSAVAVYAAGGRRALQHRGRERGGLTRQLTHQLGDD